ncbi:MAG: hypothetical protein ACTHKP_11200 [Nitrososphaeraceae archaeon]
MFIASQEIRFLVVSLQHNHEAELDYDGIGNHVVGHVGGAVLLEVLMFHR